MNEGTQQLTPVEAVYGFASWLSTRNGTLKVGNTHNPSNLMVLVGHFIDENKLGAVRDGWEKHLVHPQGEIALPVLEEATADPLEPIEAAWGIISNAYAGDWDKASPEWKRAAERWRDDNLHKIEAEVECPEDLAAILEDFVAEFGCELKPTIGKKDGVVVITSNYDPRLVAGKQHADYFSFRGHIGHIRATPI